MRTTSAILLMTALAVFVGCAQQGEKPAESQTRTAVAVLEAKSGSTVSGTATFAEDGGQIRLHIEIDNAPPGSHAFHIHDIGDCSAPDGTSARGTGFIISPEGLVATAWHLVEDATAVQVSLSSGDIYDRVDLVAVDQRRDIALLRIPGFELPVVKLGNSAMMRIGLPD